MASRTKTMDLVFLIDATGSMASSLQGAHDKATSLARLLRDESPDVDFSFGCICYRDPVDEATDRHEMLGLSPTVEDLVAFLAKVTAYGGGDTPEDWVGAYDLALHELSWRDGAKTIVHIADAPAHGSEWGGWGHEEEGPKLVPLIQAIAKRRIVITAMDIRGGATASFDACKRIYDAAQGPGFDHQVLQLGDNWGASMSIAFPSCPCAPLPSPPPQTYEADIIGQQMCVQGQYACQQALQAWY
jgi:hypothetical protein